MIKEIICSITMLFDQHTCSDEKGLPIKAVSRDGVVIAGVHAGTEHGKTHITGSVEKAIGAGTVSTAWTHLDITATSGGKVIFTRATGFFPTTIPSSRQGKRGHSEFSLYVGALPAGAEISVTVHKQPLHHGPCTENWLRTRTTELATSRVHSPG